MPITLGHIEDMSLEEVAHLRQRQGKRTDPTMEELLAALEAGRPQRVSLTEGQRARGVRVSIARRARERGLHVETAEGDGFIAVWKVDAPTPRQTRKPAGAGERRRSRLPKQQEAPQAVLDGMSETME